MRVRAVFVVASLMLCATGLWATGAQAEGVTLPHVTFDPSSAGFVEPEPTPLDMTVHGRECVPKPEMPASVLMTVDSIDGVFTATPDESGVWSIQITLDPAVTGYGWVVHASCDNYLGTNSYPDQPIPVAVAEAEGAGGAPGATLVGSDRVSAGGSVEIKGSGWGAEATVKLALHSVSVSLGDAEADSSGDFDAKVVIPAATSIGAHEISVTGDAGTVTIAITVVGSGVAQTGAHTGELSIVALALVLSGTALTIAGRPRRRTDG